MKGRYKFVRTLVLLSLALVLATGGGAAIARSAGPASSAVHHATVDPKAAGEKAAAAAGPAVKLPAETIGIIQVTGASEPMQRALSAIQTSSKILGWKTVSCDGRGDPARFSECARSLLAQNVDAIISNSVDAPAMQAQMQQAQQRGIPWINSGGQVLPSDLFTASAQKNEVRVGSAAAAYLKKLMHGKGTVAMTTAPANYSLKIRGDSGRAALLYKSKIKIVSTHEVDLANLVQDTRSWVSTVVTRFPKLTGFLFTVVTDSGAAAPIIVTRYGNKQPPNRPYIVGNGLTLANMDLIRKGQIDAVVDESSDPYHWMAVDQLAEWFARHKAIPKRPASLYPTLAAPRLITKANVPSDPNDAPQYVYDFTTFFKAKWAAEFNAH